MGKRYTYSTIWEEGIWKFFIFMELKPFFYYFVITKILNMSSEKLKIVLLDQYSPRKIPTAL